MSGVTFCIETWLPLCLTSTNPAFFSATTSSLPEITGSLGISNFNCSPERFGYLTWQVFCAETFDVKLYGFFDVSLRFFKGFPLRSYAKLRTSCNKEFVFLLNGYKECSHIAPFVLQSY